MSTKHTPGPWYYEQALDGGGMPVSFHFIISAPITPPPGCDEAFFAVADTSSKDNARLIAAAPDLLEALQALIPWAAKGAEGHQNHMIGERTVRNAQNAIDKATA